MSEPEPVDASKLRFPNAGQSDILRSVQKDKLYLSILENSLREVVLGYLGPATTLKHGNAIRTLAHCIYYATSIGVGQRTLGEEYCDLLQVTSSTSEPSTAVRVLQVLLHSSAPLLHSKLASIESCPAPSHSAPPSPSPPTSPQTLPLRSSSPRFSSAFNSAADLAEVLMANVTPVPADTLATPTSPRVARSHKSHTPIASPMAPISPKARSPTNRGTSNGNGDGNGNGNGNSHGNGHSGSSQTVHSEHRLCSRRPDPPRLFRWPLNLLQWLAHTIPSWALGVASRVKLAVAHLSTVLWHSQIAAQIVRWRSVIAQAQLALFYIFGIYFDLPKRLVGVQYVHIGARSGVKRYYGAMGLLLLVQVLVNAHAVWRSSKSTEAATTQQRRQLIVHPPAGSVDPPSTDPAAAGPSVPRSSPVSFPLQSRVQGVCPLCLADRNVPTSLPCGHIFCWKCAVEWCQRKAVCPLCRHGAQLNELVPLAHTVL